MLGAREGHYCELCILAGFLIGKKTKRELCLESPERLGILPYRLAVLPGADLPQTKCKTIAVAAEPRRQLRVGDDLSACDPKGCFMTRLASCHSSCPAFDLD
jgi:hypothetical protein